MQRMQKAVVICTTAMDTSCATAEALPGCNLSPGPRPLRAPMVSCATRMPSSKKVARAEDPAERDISPRWQLSSESLAVERKMTHGRARSRSVRAGSLISASTPPNAPRLRSSTEASGAVSLLGARQQNRFRKMLIARKSGSLTIDVRCAGTSTCHVTFRAVRLKWTKRRAASIRYARTTTRAIQARTVKCQSSPTQVSPAKIWTALVIKPVRRIETKTSNREGKTKAGGYRMK